MKKSILSTLQRIYAKSPEPVWILDENWNVVWSNTGKSVTDLPERLGIARNTWTSCRNTIILDNIQWICRLDCSAEDGTRIAVFSEAGKPIRYNQIAETVQAMSLAISALNSELEDHEVRIDTSVLNSLSGNVMRIYRLSFFLRELERGRAGIWKREVFALHQVLEKLEDPMQSALHRDATFTMQLEPVRCFTIGDATAFGHTILAALMSCIRNPENRQDMQIQLRTEAEKAILEISAAPESEVRRGYQPMIPDDLEHELIELYCRRYGIQLFFTVQKERSICRMEIPTIPDPHCIEVHSYNAAGNGGLFDPVSVVFSSFCRSYYF